MKVNLRSGGVWWEFISLSSTNSSSKMVFEYNLSSNCMSIYLPILSYYLVGICYFHWNLNWSILDSILITTGSMTAGKDIFTHSHYTRIFFSLFIIIGALLLLNLLSSLIITEVRSARDLIKKSAVSPLLKTEITDRSAYIRRLLYPLIVVAVVLITGTLYFAYSEGWTFTDSMYFCIVLRSITGSDDLYANTLQSKVFLLFYQWVFILSVMNLIASLCALRVEITELIGIRTQLKRAQNISTLALEPSYFSGDNIDQFEFLVKLLIHLDILDPKRDVENWLGAIRESCNSQSGRLSRGDILAFAESYRRKFLSLDNRKILTPPMSSSSNPLPRKASPTARAYSPILNFQPPVVTTPPKYTMELEQQVKDDRTPLLPIHTQHLSNPPSFSESPLTFGKKSSYGLFIPQGYQQTVANYESVGNEISVLYETDEEVRIGSP